MKRQSFALTALASLFILLPLKHSNNIRPNGEGVTMPGVGKIKVVKALPRLRAAAFPQAEALSPVDTPPVQQNTTSHNTADPSATSMSHAELLSAAGVSAADQPAADFIIMHEGHYDPCVINGGAVDCGYAVNGGGAAYGVCQALPGIKMASAGADWATNPITQIRWCASYAVARYGSWWSAYNYWVANRLW